MLVDNVTLYIKAGNGGNGAATFLRNAKTAKGGPDGGSGGNGGNIYIQGSHNISDLRQFRFQKKIIASDGIKGKRKNLFGKNAPHQTILVPLGTRVTDTESGSSFEITDATNQILLAQGGKGGLGNTQFKTATNQTPLLAQEGTIGESKNLLLELRLIADIGLIGLPNSGKSSLLAVLTNAKPKIGNYAFTTLEPNIGVFEKYTIADIPGLIEGASHGRGLGVTFLKHIEKTRLLIHCIDSSAADSDAQQAYETVHHEFKEYNTSLLEKPEIIVLTKSDLTDEKKLKEMVKIFKKKGKKTIITCSIYNQESLDILKQTIKNFPAML